MSAKAVIDVPHLATLARLALADTPSNDDAGGAPQQSAPQTVAAVTAHLQNIITMVDQMQAVDTNGIEPMAHPLDATQRLREDRVTEEVDAHHFQSHAPSTQDNFYLVPRVVE